MKGKTNWNVFQSFGLALRCQCVMLIRNHVMQSIGLLPFHVHKIHLKRKKTILKRKNHFKKLINFSYIQISYIIFWLIGIQRVEFWEFLSIFYQKSVYCSCSYVSITATFIQSHIMLSYFPSVQICNLPTQNFTRRYGQFFAY